MRVGPAWQLLDLADNRAGAFRKAGRPEPGDDWEAQPYNRGYPDFGFLILTERLPIQAHHAARQGRRVLGVRVPALRRAWHRVSASRQ
jgi:hypothetical protein